MPRKLLVLLACSALAGSALAGLPVGPVYLDRFPTLEVVVEPPGLEPQVLSAVEAADLELVENGILASRALGVRLGGRRRL